MPFVPVPRRWRSAFSGAPFPPPHRLFGGSPLEVIVLPCMGLILEILRSAYPHPLMACHVASCPYRLPGAGGGP